jgi:hypothetical protein
MVRQMDSELWRQGTCVLGVTRDKDSAVLLRRPADDGGVETEMSKYLALNRLLDPMLSALVRNPLIFAGRVGRML